MGGIGFLPLLDQAKQEQHNTAPTVEMTRLPIQP
jgi:hypothetical protein